LAEVWFWGLLVLWILIGSSMPLVWVKVAGKDGRNMILMLVALFLLAAIMYGIYAPYDSAFTIGFLSGITFEATLWYRSSQGRR
jgi:inner membrane protein involved in colicin E2 resistance